MLATSRCSATSAARRSGAAAMKCICLTIALRLGWGGERGMVYFFASQPVAADRCAGYVIIGRNYDDDQQAQVTGSSTTVCGRTRAGPIGSAMPQQIPIDLPAVRPEVRTDAVA